MISFYFFPFSKFKIHAEIFYQFFDKHVLFFLSEMLNQVWDDDKI